MEDLQELYEIEKDELIKELERDGVDVIAFLEDYYGRKI